jgi:hypothetical protein
VVPRTPWGDPDFQGAYGNSAERLTPMERPESFAGRRLNDISTAELTPGPVAIVPEMIHDTRVIPLDRRPRVGPAVRSYMRDSRGYFDGDAMVVETTNFTDKASFLGSSEKLRLTERFTLLSADVIEWRVTVLDPETWTRSWTFAMNLTRGNARPLEYACHEGNYFIHHALSAARAAEHSGVKQ